MIDDLVARFADLPTGAWNRPPTRAAVVSIAQTSRARPVGFLAVGLNPYRPFNEPYAAFLRLVAGQIGASLAHARTLTEVSSRGDTIRGSRARGGEGDYQGDYIGWIVAHAPVAIAVLHGPEHIYTLANERYRRLVGARHLIGRPVREALSELAGQGVYEILDHVYRTGEPYMNDAVRLMLDEQGNGIPDEHFYDLSLQPLHEADPRAPSRRVGRAVRGTMPSRVRNLAHDFILRLLHHEYGARRVAQYMAGDAAKHNAWQPGEPAAPHDDQIGMRPLCRSDDLLAWIAEDDGRGH
ncbi:MAG TPA: PAS domain-containing protein, partial [Gemmatimonadaceae bacterium]|nr:PAS domain-containing protein [Gemmatimonadaceae bacterium]